MYATVIPRGFRPRVDTRTTTMTEVYSEGSTGIFVLRVFRADFSGGGNDSRARARARPAPQAHICRRSETKHWAAITAPSAARVVSYGRPAGDGDAPSR